MGWEGTTGRVSPTHTIAPATSWRFPYEAAAVDFKRLVSLDFETYYDDDYTLKKLSTSEYVRDPRFEAQMCGIKIGRGPTRVHFGADIRKALAKIDWSTHSVLCHHAHFDGLILSHHYGVVPAKYYCSLSMARAWLSNDIGSGLDEVSKYLGGRGKLDEGKALWIMKGVRLAQMNATVRARGASYCQRDVQEMLEVIFKTLLPNFSQAEIDLIDATVQMFTCPVLVLDEARARTALKEEIAARNATIVAAAPEAPSFDAMDATWRREYKAAGHAPGDVESLRLFAGRKAIGSSPRFAGLLQAEGIDPPLKVSPAWLKLPENERDPDNQFIYAFSASDPGFQDLLDDPDPRVRALCEARLAVKSNSNITRAERLLRSGAAGRALPVYYGYARAHTWRFGGGDLQNWQNFKRGGELRLSIRAPRGYVLIIGDSRQIEARLNAWFWGQDDLVQDFRDEKDVYSEFASESVYGRKITKADKNERHVGKTAVLGLGYQMGDKRFAATLAAGTGGPIVKISREESAIIVMAYRARYPMIVRGWAICESIISDMHAGRRGEYKCIRWEKETIWLPNGMRLKYPRLHRTEEGDWAYVRKGNLLKLYGGIVCENIIQALARIIVAAEQLLGVSRRYPVVMTTHDEIVALVKKPEARQAEKFIMGEMSQTPVWAPGLPIAAELIVSENYSK